MVHFKVEALNSCCWTLTTSKKNKGWSKLGFFCVFLMTVEWTTCPPHSNSILGDATLASWYLFMLRTPQHNTCGRKPHSKTSRLKEEDRWTKIQEGKDRGWAEIPIFLQSSLAQRLLIIAWPRGRCKEINEQSWCHGGQGGVSRQ